MASSRTTEVLNPGSPCHQFLMINMADLAKLVATHLLELCLNHSLQELIARESWSEPGETPGPHRHL
eukprot:3475961-Amphidinium_carterae.1